MARIFITGSSDGIGYSAARQLLDDGHDVVLHARSAERAAALRDRLSGDTKRGHDAPILIANLEHHDEIVGLAEAANATGTFDAVIHNAGLGYRQPERRPTPNGHSNILVVNVFAPYVLTALMHPPKRLVYLSSGLHRDGNASLDDLDWTSRPWDGLQAYSDSKLFDTTLAFAVARAWPTVRSNSVEPGWVATKMGGPGATDDLAQAHLTQTWLAVSDDSAAAVTGRHFYHQRERDVHPAARDTAFQDALMARLAATGITFPPAAH